MKNKKGMAVVVRRSVGRHRGKGPEPSARSHKYAVVVGSSGEMRGRERQALPVLPVGAPGMRVIEAGGPHAVAAVGPNPGGEQWRNPRSYLGLFARRA